MITDKGRIKKREYVDIKSNPEEKQKNEDKR